MGRDWSRPWGGLLSVQHQAFRKGPGVRRCDRSLISPAGAHSAPTVIQHSFLLWLLKSLLSSIILSCCSSTHCVRRGWRAGEQNTHSWHAGLLWGIEGPSGRDYCCPWLWYLSSFPPPTYPVLHNQSGSLVAAAEAPGAGSDMKQCLWQRGACVLRLRRHWLAGSEVMQCSLNVATAEPASRVCLPTSLPAAVWRRRSLGVSGGSTELSGSQDLVCSDNIQGLCCHCCSLSLHLLNVT